MGIHSLESLLTTGEFIGRTSQSGLNCLRNIFSDGKTVFTMLDKDMNIVKQSVKTTKTIGNGTMMQRFLPNGEKYLESHHLEGFNKDLKYNWKSNIFFKYGGPKHSMITNKTRSDYRWSIDGTQNPYLETATAKSVTPDYNPVKYTKKNIVSGDSQTYETAYHSGFYPYGNNYDSQSVLGYIDKMGSWAFGKEFKQIK